MVLIASAAAILGLLPGLVVGQPMDLVFERLPGCGGGRREVAGDGAGGGCRAAAGERGGSV